MADPIRDIALNDDGSFDKTGGDFNFVAGRAATKQGVRIRLRTFKREVFCDQDVGVDHVNKVLGKSDPVVAREEIRAGVLRTPDVTEVSAANIVQGLNRTASIKIRYRDAYSEGAVDDTVAVPGQG